MRQRTRALGEPTHQRCVEPVEQELDDAVVGVGHDGAQLVAFFYVLSTLAHVRLHAEHRSVAGRHHEPGFEAFDPVVDFLDLAFDRKQVLLALPQVGAGHGDRREAGGVGLQEQSFLREQGGLGPLDLRGGLFSVGEGPIRPHPGFVAVELALEAAKRGVREQVFEHLEAALFKRLRKLGVGADLPGHLD